MLLPALMTLPSVPIDVAAMRGVDGFYSYLRPMPTTQEALRTSQSFQRWIVNLTAAEDIPSSITAR